MTWTWNDCVGFVDKGEKKAPRNDTELKEFCAMLKPAGSVNVIC